MTHLNHPAELRQTWCGVRHTEGVEVAYWTLRGFWRGTGAALRQEELCPDCLAAWERWRQTWQDEG